MWVATKKLGLIGWAVMMLVGYKQTDGEVKYEDWYNDCLNKLLDKLSDIYPKMSNSFILVW